MSLVAVVYHSITGNTAKVADAVCEGVRSSGASVAPLKVCGTHIVEGRFENPEVLRALDLASAIVFGAPTFMGGPSSQFKAFADASSDRWERQLWRNKFAAGFTTGSAPNGDQTSTLQYFTVLAAQHGMLWVSLDRPRHVDSLAPNSQGVQLGVSAVSSPSGVSIGDLQTAAYLGARIGQIAYNSTRSGV